MCNIKTVMYHNLVPALVSDGVGELPRSVTSSSEFPTPVIIRALGIRATKAFWEFFTASLSNANTRAAYYRAVISFCSWMEAQGFGLLDLEPVIVAAYMEKLKREMSIASVKQHLAALRQFFDHLVVAHVIRTNPAASVRSPRYAVREGKTPVLSKKEASKLLRSFSENSLIDLRDRAFIALLLYTFARVSAVTALSVEDYFEEGGEWFLRLREKGSKEHVLPVHPKLKEYLEAYLKHLAPKRARLPLFRTANGRQPELTSQPMSRQDAFRMIRRRISAQGITAPVGCHSFRATGITNFLASGGSLETAQLIANHASAKTTKLYDRNERRITQEALKSLKF